MRTLFSICIGAFISLQALCQPKVYFDFVSHNEETFQWNNNTFYENNRTRLFDLATYFQSRGITWNMQSDWVYLSKVLTEDSTLTSNTNNKNMLRWMWEDRGVEMDPHGHETQYIYPDLVHLMDSIGLPESKLMGGTLYNQSNGINVWMNLINGQYGNVFPTKFWQPDYMMGGGTPNHVADLKYYGFWNPQDTVNYLTHQPANHLKHIGIGCEMKIRDTTTVSVFVNELRDVVQKVQSGQYPANGFYIQSIFFSQADLNNIPFYTKVLQIADSANAIVSTGVAEWKTLKQAYTLWDSLFGSQVFQWECGNISTSLNSVPEIVETEIYPNPMDNFATVKINHTKMEDYELTIYDVQGRKIKKYLISSQLTEISIENLESGMYFYQLTGPSQPISSGKLLVN
ncbi:MAG: T9SS type A sorting domain-containing protein [Bacteroidia bacterium]|nr:T9SS type A sorting domain-containing protein [Bacteroidia bacterium]